MRCAMRCCVRVWPRVLKFVLLASGRRTLLRLTELFGSHESRGCSKTVSRRLWSFLRATPGCTFSRCFTKTQLHIAFRHICFSLGNSIDWHHQTRPKHTFLGFPACKALAVYVCPTSATQIPPGGRVAFSSSSRSAAAAGGGPRDRAHRRGRRADPRRLPRVRGLPRARGRGARARARGEVGRARGAAARALYPRGGCTQRLGPTGALV